MMTPEESFEQWLKLQPPAIAAGLTLVPVASQPGPPLHISVDHKIKKFIPSITRRTGLTENRSVPRVSTAPTLIGCLLGYVSAYKDFFDPKEVEKKTKDGKTEIKLLQEWAIYRFDVTHTVKPNVKLLYDQKVTDEQWLSTYSESTREFIPEIIGYGFYRDVLLIGRAGNHPRRQITLMVHVTADRLVLSKNHILTKGHWEIICDDPSIHLEGWTDDKSFRVRQVTKSDYTYKDNRQYSVSFEHESNLSNNTPSFSLW